MNRLSIGAGLALLVFALPATAAPETYRFKGETAYASFGRELNECAYMFVDIYAYANIGRNDRGSPKQSSVSVSYDISNSCTGDFWSSEAVSDNLNFQVVSSLKSASLTGKIPLYDSSTHAEREISIDLKWTGVGEVTRTHSQFKNRSPDFIYFYRFNGTYRDASVEGNILLDGNSLLRDLSYGYAGLYSANSGTADIYRY